MKARSALVAVALAGALVQAPLVAQAHTTDSHTTQAAATKHTQNLPVGKRCGAWRVGSGLDMAFWTNCSDKWNQVHVFRSNWPDYYQDVKPNSTRGLGDAGTAAGQVYDAWLSCSSPKRCGR